MRAWATKKTPDPVHFVADLDTTLVQQVLDVPELKRETNTNHDRQADHLGTYLKVFERVSFGHAGRLQNRPARLNLNPPGKHVFSACLTGSEQTAATSTGLSNSP